MTLTPNEIHMFNDLAGGPISDGIDGHHLVLDWFKTVRGFRARCSCGTQFGPAGGKGIDRAAFAYDRMAIKKKFNDHIARCSKANL